MNMEKLPSWILGTVLPLALTACEDPKPNPCVQKGQVCCIVTTGPGQEVEQCVQDGAACADLARRFPANPPPQTRTSNAVNVCLKG